MRSGELTGSIGLGFDSFHERYTVVDSDTTAGLNEFRARVTLGYLQGQFLQDYLQIEGQSLIGEESVETSGRMNLLRRSGPYRFAFDNELTYRSYRKNTTYTFANDFVRYNGKVYLQRQLSSALFMRLTDRLEIIDFDKFTTFDYDYINNAIWLLGEYQRDLTTAYTFAAGFRTKAIPDTTQIAYKAYTAAAELRHVPGLRKQVFVSLSGERRVYNDTGIRSPYYSLYSDARIQPLAWGDFALSFDNTLEGFRYDQANEVFFNYVENRSALRGIYYRSSLFFVGLGPTFGFLSSGESDLDEYTEWGAKFTLDYTVGGAWISAGYEPGWRDYRVEGRDNYETIFSDFVYHRLMLFATARIWDGASVNVFASFEPEKHSYEPDDATATLFSVDVTYGF